MSHIQELLNIGFTVTDRELILNGVGATGHVVLFGVRRGIDYSIYI